MYRGKSVIAIVPAYNEEAKIGKVVERTDRSVVDTLLVVDDGSSDATARVARQRGAEVLSLGRLMGVGAALRSGFESGRRTGHDLAVVKAGNNKEASIAIIAITTSGRVALSGRRALRRGHAVVSQAGHPPASVVD